MPYTAGEVKILYPALTEVECLLVAGVEERFPGWHVWPHVDYPQTHIWLARKNSTSMPPLVTGMIGDMPGEVAYWISENSSRGWSGS
jgi:hypothetical protein